MKKKKLLLLFLLLIPGFGCSRTDNGPENPVSTVRIETENGERILDLNLYAFDATTGALLEQQYRVSPSSEFRFNSIPSGALIRLAAIANTGEKRLAPNSGYDDLLQVEVPIDSLEGAHLHKEGCWLMASDRTNRTSIFRTDTLAVVTLHPLFTRLGLRIDATSLKQWNVELRDVRLLSPEGTCHIWAKTFAPVGKEFAQVVTTEEFTALQNALSSKERTPAVYFHVPDASAGESEASIQVSARLHAKSDGMTLTRTWTARVRDLLPIHWKEGVPISAILHLTDGNAGTDGQWSCIDDEPTRSIRFRFGNAPLRSSEPAIRSAAVLLYSTLPPGGYHSNECTPLASGMVSGNEVYLELEKGTLGNTPSLYYLAVANPTERLYQRLLQPDGALDEIFTTAAEEDPDYPFLWGCGTLDGNNAEDISLPVNVHSGLVKVSLSDINHSVRNDNRDILLKRIFLINASAQFYPHFIAGDWDINRDSYTRKYYYPSAPYIPGSAGWPDTDVNGYGITTPTPSFMSTTIMQSIGKEEICNDTFTLYTYPNATADDAWSTLEEVRSWDLLEGNWTPRHTRLVLEVEIAGQTRWYPITLPVLLPGRWYQISGIRLVNSGSSSPDIPASRTDMTYSLHIQSWGYASISETI